jgi:hypothetical protein
MKWNNGIVLNVKVKIVEGRVKMSYLGKTVPLSGLKCPECGVAYLPEELVIKKVMRAEEMIENK